MDMVAEKKAGVTHCFETDPIIPIVDGDWVKTQGTTLGADNGIGMAAQLAILDDNTLSHGRLECLFTNDEEIGLLGAAGIKPGFLRGKYLLNLDSEEEGVLFIGCAGGMNSQISFSFQKESSPADLFFFSVSLDGLQGGHSGDDIDKGRGNANHLLARLLWEIQEQMTIRLDSFQGGNLSNAIPREARFVAGVPAENKETVAVLVNNYWSELEEELGELEPGLTLTLASEPACPRLLSEADTRRFIAALYACPTGVIAMSHTMPGLVETSLNLASVKPLSAEEWLITTSQRSSIESAKWALSKRIKALFSLAAMPVEFTEGYPGWNPNPDSPLVQQVAAIYRELFGQEARIRAIHAGLECGLFLKNYPELDMVSFGPTLRGVHSPDERIYIPSVKVFWVWLLEILKRL
jgi:dipeptidase D